MRIRVLLLVCATQWAALAASAQQAPATSPADPAGTWQPAGGSNDGARTANSGGASLAPSGLERQEPRITQVNKGSGALPNDHGQVWREYDISPYTSRITSTEKPEQAIVDWILRETGTEVWFSEPLGLLNASKSTLRVYHTPEMQRLILDVVDRFVSSQAESHALGLRLVTLTSPNWRSTALPMLRPIDVKTPGIDAWLVSKENAAVLLAQLGRRADYREQNSPNILIQNGQSHTITRLTPRNYVRSVRLRPEVWPGHELEMGQLQEGSSLQLSPLLSLDGSTVDAVIKCQIDQIEKFVSVPIDVPSAGGGTQRVQVQVPQVVSWRLQERFRWPTEQVLLLSCGVVAAPTPERLGPLGIPLPSLPGVPLPTSSGRADAILFVECKGKASQQLMEAKRDPRDGSPKYNGRY